MNVKKTFVGRKPQSLYRMTETGRAALAEYVRAEAVAGSLNRRGLRKLALWRVIQGWGLRNYYFVEAIPRRAGATDAGQRTRPYNMVTDTGLVQLSPRSEMTIGA